MMFNEKPLINAKIANLAAIVSLFSMLNILFPQAALAQKTAIAPVTEAAVVNASVSIIDWQSFPVSAQLKAKKSFYLTVTAYSSTVDQCDGDPFTTASGEKVRDGIIAHNFLPFGTRVSFPDIYPDKIFTVKDRLNPRYGHYHADIWMPTRQAALQWGARVIKMEIY